MLVICEKYDFKVQSVSNYFSIADTAEIHISEKKRDRTIELSVKNNFSSYNIVKCLFNILSFVCELCLVKKCGC